jgi:putative phage-type endonuclease
MTEEITQGSDAWHQMRLGKITASRIANIMTKVKSGESAYRKRAKFEIIRERITGRRIESYKTTLMQRGIDLEPLARAKYEHVKNVMIDQIAFVNHPTVPMAGASPDGLIGDHALLEIKCPSPENHLGHLIDDGADLVATYNAQCQWQLACMPDRKYVDLVSFDPDQKEHLQLFIKRLYKDEAWIAEAEKEVIALNDEIENIILKLEEFTNG